MSSKFVRRMLVAAGLVALLWAGYDLFRRQRGLANAVELAQFELWEQARAELVPYLQLHPGDAPAHFLMADLWVNDEQLLSSESVPQALAHLQRIPDDSPLAAVARTHEAKLQFLVLHKPVLAEKLLRKAISLEENSLEAHQLLSKVLELTGRYHECEPLFWRIYELTPADGRALRLRDWYMSQFFPSTANEELERRMGFTDAAQSSIPAEAVRYLRFRETEPAEPLGRAALARWTRRAGKPGEALSLLDADDDSLDNEMQTAFFVATRIDLLVDLGQFDRADDLFQKWPEPREGFDYWRLKAVVLEEAHGEFDSALEAYDLALKTWPGPAEWRLLHRKAGCLARAGKSAEAVETRARAKVVEQLMEDKVHRRLRYVLGFLDKPDYLGEVVEFYRKLGRTREVEAWSRELAGRVAETLK